MKRIKVISIAAGLVTAALLTGCNSSGSGDDEVSSTDFSVSVTAVDIRQLSTDEAIALDNLPISGETLEFN